MSETKTNSQNLDNDETLYIPLPFWYNTDTQLAVPIVAIYDDTVREEVMDEKNEYVK